jgi:hypothetical protein
MKSIAINARIENSYLVKTKVCAKEKLKIQSQAHSDTAATKSQKLLESCQYHDDLAIDSVAMS